MTGVSVFCVVSIVIAVVAHAGSKEAERRARASYREFVGDDYDPPNDAWREIRPVAGGWGCLSAVLSLLRGISFATALAAVLYLATG